MHPEKQPAFESVKAELPQTNSPPPTLPPVMAQPPMPPSVPSAPQPAQTAASLAVDDAMAADDIDLIEKEWVYRAKAIVGGTKDDPHKQNKEINKMKVDYIKKRYNKDLKVSEE